MKTQVSTILKKIKEPIDIVWSFDLGDIYPFRLFPSNSLKIFHPVDEPLNESAINSAKNADIIFSVTKEIVEKYQEFNIPAVVINHGVGEIFLQQEILKREDKLIRIGFSGNLLRKDIDRPVLLEIVMGNPLLQFEFWGSLELKGANMGGDIDNETIKFLNTLKELPNVILHGMVSGDELASAYRFMDAFLICYDIEKDQSKGTNYHKIMEFLSAGKLIISNNVSAYADSPELIQMTAERTSNSGLPALFKSCIDRIEELNNVVLINKRIAYAKSNSYKNQVERIEVELLKLGFTK